MHLRGPLLALLFTTLAFAGCLDDDEPEPTTPTIRPTHIDGAGTAGIAHIAGQFEPDQILERPFIVTDAIVGTVLDAPFDTFEPTIGATSDGCLYLTNIKGTGGGTAIQRTCDQGGSWTDMGPWIGDPLVETPVRCFPNSNDPWLHVDRETDRIFTSDLHALITSTLSYSDDGGETWICNLFGGGIPPGVHDHQSITTATPRTVTTIGYENVVYYCINRVADTSCATSLNGGIGFGPMVTIWPGVDIAPEEGNVPELCGGLSGHVEADHEGRVMIGRSYCGAVEVAVSDDDGLTWNIATITTRTGLVAGSHEVRMAADEANNLYAMWHGEDAQAYYATSTDHGETWSAPMLITAPGITASDKPSIYAGGPGMIAVAYIGTTHEEGLFPENAEPNEQTWNGYLAVSYNALDEAPLFTTVSTNDPADPTWRGICGGTRCGGFGDFIDVTIDPDGRPWAAFADHCAHACIDDPATGNNIDIATMGTLSHGLSLWDGSPLPPLQAAPTDA